MNNPILYPLMTFIAFVFGIAPLMLFTRVKAANAGKVRLREFRNMQFEGAPDVMVRFTRHWANLFEMPVIFYVLCLLALILNIKSSNLITLAWAYVAFRILHAVVHVTYNNVYHRMSMFFASVFCLMLMWLDLMLKIS